MTIIQEMPSWNGNIRENIIHNVTKRITLSDQEWIKGAKKPVDVIWVTLKNSCSYPIAYFGSNMARMDAFTLLKQTREEYVTLEYSTYFGVSLIPDKKVQQLMKEIAPLNLGAALKYSLSTIIGANTKTLDAFSSLEFSIRDISNSKIWIPENLSKLWARTLRIPKVYKDNGISENQFWSILIKEHNYEL